MMATATSTKRTLVADWTWQGKTEQFVYRGTVPYTHVGVYHVYAPYAGLNDYRAKWSRSEAAAARPVHGWQVVSVVPVRVIQP